MTQLVLRKLVACLAARRYPMNQNTFSRCGAIVLLSAAVSLPWAGGCAQDSTVPAKNRQERRADIRPATRPTTAPVVRQLQAERTQAQPAQAPEQAPAQPQQAQTPVSSEARLYDGFGNYTRK